MSIETDQTHMASQPTQKLSEHPGPEGGQPPRQGRPRRARIARITILTLLVCLVVLLGGDITRIATQPKAQPVVISGPFVQQPLNASQIDALQHMAQRMNYKALAGMYVSRMSLDQKLGQLFMVQYYGTGYSSDLETMIHDQYAGGVIMYAAQMNTLKQTQDDIIRMQKKAGLPLLISADEEGGYVERVNNIFGHLPGALEMYNTGKVSNAAKLGHTIAHELQTLGINTDLAPDVDVPVVSGPDQYLRTWGYTPQSVIEYGGAYLRAIQGDNEIACLKHFPGLGAAKTDAHTGLPVVNRSRDDLYSTELVPFKHFIQSKNKLDNPGMIMTTDVLMPAIDPQWPAELSHSFVTDILRHEFGYDGVVITDALYMDGIAKKWDLPRAVVLSLEAGNDMILGVRDSYDLSSSVAAIKQALDSGQLSMARINESVTRIIALKIQYHLLPVPQF